jgi:hypothetical protein
MTVGKVTSRASPLQRWSDRLLAWLPFVSLLGAASLVTNLVLSFEEPHSTMLLGSAVLISAAPVGMLVHLSTTSKLTANEKRKWVTGLTSRQGPTLFAAYFSASERGRATRRLSQPDQDPT